MPGKKKERRSYLDQLTKQHIQESVKRIIMTRGVPGLTMDRIAGEAGVAKGTLYRHFKTKNELLRTTMDNCLVHLMEELFEILDRDLAPDARLEQMILRHLSFFDEHRDFFRVLLYERSLVQSSLARYRNSRYRQFVEKTAKVVEEGIRAGLFKPLDALKVAAMIVEADIAMNSQRLRCDKPDPVELDARILSSVFLRGIKAEPAVVKESV